MRNDIVSVDRANFDSYQKIVNHMAMHVGEASVDTVVPDGQTRVVDSEQMQDCGVDIVACGRMFAF